MVSAGSLRLHYPGSYATAETNATAPGFCCKRTNKLHYAEPFDKVNHDSSWERDFNGTRNGFKS